ISSNAVPSSIRI
ncbi:acetyltransferase family protein, partial [Vibrio parahaemolyticus V-223/04]